MKPDEHLEVFMDRLINRSDIYFQQWRHGDEFGYRCVDPTRDSYKPLDKDRIRQHLQGTITLSTVAIDAEGMSKWACWDNDHDDGKLDELENLLVKLGFNPLRESKREGRDGHTWLFFDRPVSAAHLGRVAEEIRAQLGWQSGVVEFFPKSWTRLSQVRLPLGINRKPEAMGARGWFSGAPQTVAEQIEWFAAQPLNDSARWLRIARALAKVDEERAKSASKRRQSFGLRQPFEPTDIRRFIELRQRGSELVGPCPLCRAEGHDRHGDNLRASLDGQKFCCVYGGPGSVHRGADIVRQLTK